jgi:23S rRNA (guanosine2251-2'-O)-methyltransferase
VIIYGRNPVREALRGRRQVRQVWAIESAAKEPWLEGVPVTVVDPYVVAERSESEDHQGICADAGGYPYADSGRMLVDDDAFVIALDEVQDPQNLGAVARVAESAGVTGLIIPERRSAEVTPAVCKASAGAVEHLAIAHVPNLANWLADAKEQGAWIYGAAAEPPAVPYDTPDYSGRVVLVLGSEGKGLRPRVADTCDELIRLPQHGEVGSLNVASAAAAIVYGILHFRGGGVDRAT